MAEASWFDFWERPWSRPVAGPPEPRVIKLRPQRIPDRCSVDAWVNARDLGWQRDYLLELHRQEAARAARPGWHDLR